MLFPDGAVSLFLLRFSRGVLQEGPFSCLRAFLGTAAGALTCCCRHPFPSTVSFDAPDSVRGPLEEDPLRPVARCAPMCPAQSDIRLGVPLSSSSETHPGGCWRVAGRTEEGTCPLRRALCVCVALTAAAAAAHTGAAPPAGPSMCTGCFPALGLGVRAGRARSCPHVQWAPGGMLPLRSAGSGAVQAGRGLMPALPRASCHRVPDAAHLLGVLVCL